ARHTHALLPSIFTGDLSARACSSRYMAPAMNASRNAYCRTSAESATMGGRKLANNNPIHATLRLNARCSQRKNSQQKTVPAITEGRRNTTSEVPSARQRYKIKISPGGCAVERLAL